MSHYKEAKVFLLPTENKSDLYLSTKLYPKIFLNYVNHFDYPNDEYIKKQDLYFVFDRLNADKSTHLRLNDWYLVELYNVEGKSIGMQLEQVLTIDDCWINNDTSVEKIRHQDNCKKIIVTTNKYIHIDNIIYPVPSQDFIEWFTNIFNEKYNINYTNDDNLTHVNYLQVLVKYIGAVNHDKRGNKYDTLQYIPYVDSNNQVCIKTGLSRNPVSPKILDIINWTM